MISDIGNAESTRNHPRFVLFPALSAPCPSTFPDFKFFADAYLSTHCNSLTPACPRMHTRKFSLRYATFHPYFFTAASSAAFTATSISSYSAWSFLITSFAASRPCASWLPL